MSLIASNPWERRKKTRFALQREVRYKVWDRKKRIGGGTGWTTDMCSKGVAFTTEEYLPQGSRVEISVSWPVLLNDDCAIRLIGCGYVVRSGIGSAACRITRFEFRTQAKIITADLAMRGAAA